MRGSRPFSRSNLAANTSHKKRRRSNSSSNTKLTRNRLKRHSQAAGYAKRTAHAAQQHAEVAAHDVTGRLVSCKVAKAAEARPHVSLIEMMGSSSSNQSMNTGTDMPFVTSGSSRLLKNCQSVGMCQLIAMARAYNHTCSIRHALSSSIFFVFNCPSP